MQRHPARGGVPGGAASVVATPAALASIAGLVAEHGPVLFFQSGGCCDGSLPICFGAGELRIGDNDVLLGTVGGCPFYVDARQYEAWRRPVLVLDVRPGDPEGFSLGAGPGAHFVTTDAACPAARDPAPG